MDQAIFENGIKEVRVLPSQDDEHGGIIVEMKEPMDPNEFSEVLSSSLSQWKLQGKKGVLIKLPIELVNLVDTTVKEGFWFHHAEPHYLMLVCWIPETLSTIPANATHRQCFGAIVMNHKGELFVVLEKHGWSKGKGIWKLPTGILEEGEEIFSCARREVKEETGIADGSTYWRAYARAIQGVNGADLWHNFTTCENGNPSSTAHNVAADIPYDVPVDIPHEMNIGTSQPPVESSQPTASSTPATLTPRRKEKLHVRKNIGVKIIGKANNITSINVTQISRGGKSFVTVKSSRCN